MLLIWFEGTQVGLRPLVASHRWLPWVYLYARSPIQKHQTYNWYVRKAVGAGCRVATASSNCGHDQRVAAAGNSLRVHGPIRQRQGNVVAGRIEEHWCWYSIPSTPQLLFPHVYSNTCTPKLSLCSCSDHSLPWWIKTMYWRAKPFSHFSCFKTEHRP